LAITLIDNLPLGLNLRLDRLRLRNGRGRLYGLARAELHRLERDLRHASYVDADRRQNPTRADAVDQSFLARHTLSDFARPWHVVNPSRDRYVRDLFRFYRSQSAHSEKRWRDQTNHGPLA